MQSKDLTIAETPTQRDDSPREAQEASPLLDSSVSLLTEAFCRLVAQILARALDPNSAESLTTQDDSLQSAQGE